MARIKTIFPYGGATKKMRRLGLQPLVEEIQNILRETEIRVLERKHANGAAVVREMIDRTFAGYGWDRKTSGDIDWMKCKIVNGTRVCVGVEIQVSARSELLYKDVLHLRNRVVTGDIDLGIIVVPSDRFQSFLPDRTPSISYAIEVLRVTDAESLPILLIEIKHDGPGPALKKKRTSQPNPAV